jgi:hypothetical protein
LDFCSTLISRNLSLISLLQEKKEQRAGKKVHSNFTNEPVLSCTCLFCSIMKGLGWKVSGAFKKMTGGSSSRSRGGSSSYTPEPMPTPSTTDYEEEEQYEEMQAELQDEVIEIDTEDAPYLDLRDDRE